MRVKEIMNVSLHLFNSLLLFILFSPDAHATDVGKDRLRKACPGVVVWESKKSEERSVISLPSSVTKGELRRQILKMEKKDQTARNISPEQLSGGHTKAFERLGKVDGYNLKVLRKIVGTYGVPTAQMIGLDGVQAFWLLVQHADGDIHLQERVLQEIRSGASGIPLDEIALLTDRVRINQGRPQIYGTQFYKVGDTFVPKEIEDAADLNERRKKMGLMPLSDYECVLRETYGRTVP